MVGDREPVRLVAHTLQQVQALARAREDDRVRLGGQPHLLQPLREPAHCHIRDAEVREHVRGRLDLRLATVDDQQVGRVGELARPPGLRVDSGTMGGCVGWVDLDRSDDGGFALIFGAVTGVLPGRGGRLGEVTAEPPPHDLGDRGDVPALGAAPDLEPPVLRLAREPVLEHHQRRHDVAALHVADVDALDAQRRAVEPERVLDLLQRSRARGQVARPAQLVLGERLRGVAGDGLGEGPLVAALRHPDLHAGAAQPGEPLGQRRGVGRQLGHQDLARHGLLGVVGGTGERRLLAVELGEEALHELRRVGGLDLVDHPAALAAHAPAADVEDLHRGLQLVLGERDDVGVGAVAEHHGLLLHGAAQRPDVVAQPRRALELQLLCGLRHLALELPDEVVGAPGQEVAEVLDDVAVLVGVHATHTRRRALVDVAEQAGPADLPVPLEHPRAAGAGREDAQQHVEGLADRPRVGVRAEVPHALAPRPAVDVQPRELLVHRDGQHRVGLVVAVADVEPRVELLDPVVLELEGLDLGAHHGPLDAGGRGDHLPGARVQAGEVGEVRVEPLAQALGLADVDDPAVRVGEAVHPRGLRDGPRGRAVRGGIGHDLTRVGPVPDTPGSGPVPRRVVAWCRRRQLSGSARRGENPPVTAATAAR